MIFSHEFFDFAGTKHIIIGVGGTCGSKPRASVSASKNTFSDAASLMECSFITICAPTITAPGSKAPIRRYSGKVLYDSNSGEHLAFGAIQNTYLKVYHTKI